MLRSYSNYTLVTSGATTAQTKMISTKDFVNCVIEVVTVGFSGTLNFYQSCSESLPDLTSAASATNKYAPVWSIDLDAQVFVSGTTGYTYTTSTNVQYFEINTNLNTFVGAKYTRSAGTITINVVLSSI